MKTFTSPWVSLREILMKSIKSIRCSGLKTVILILLIPSFTSVYAQLTLSNFDIDNSDGTISGTISGSVDELGSTANSWLIIYQYGVDWLSAGANASANPVTQIIDVDEASTIGIQGTYMGRPEFSALSNQDCFIIVLDNTAVIGDVISFNFQNSVFSSIYGNCDTSLLTNPQVRIGFGSVTPPNNTPSDINLSSNSLGVTSTGVNSVVGALSTTDDDGGDTHTYTLVSGEGDTDNNSFNIDGANLRTNSALSEGTYSLRINTNDGTDDFSKAFEITVINDDVTTYFITTWKTDNVGPSSDTSISIPTNPNYTYNYDVDWDGDGTFDDLGLTGDASHDYGVAGTYEVRIRGQFPHLYFNDDLDDDDFDTKDHYKLLTVDQWGSLEWSSMSYTFTGCINLSFNATDTPDLSNVGSMSYMFYHASTFNSVIGNWDVSNVTAMNDLFNEAYMFNQDLSNWDVSSVTDMSEMFEEAYVFNQSIGNWDVSNVTDMEQMFHEASAFNQDISSWTVTSVLTMADMFEEASTFNQNIGSWNVTSVTNMEDMFKDASTFNQPIGSWNVSNVTTMAEMFEGTVFNQDISSWNVSNVLDMTDMFEDASVFNQDISGWNVSSVTNMSDMFMGALVFNQDIGSWNVSNVLEFDDMFNGAVAFNQDISGWDVSSGSDFSSMFEGAVAFDQFLSNWDISNANLLESMFTSGGLSQSNYDATLIAWSQLALQSDLEFDAGSSMYCAAETARQAIIDNFGWTIYDGGRNCTPVVSAFDPVIAGNGETVSITGTNFDNITNVFFGATEAQSFSVVSDTEITAIVANGATGDVTVTNSHGSSALEGFIYKVAEYFFDNDLLDETDSDLDGTEVGTVTFDTGSRGDAVCFDGSSGFVKLPNNLISDIPQFTISLRFKTTGRGVILSYQNLDPELNVNPSTYIPILLVNGDGYLRGTMWTSANSSIQAFSSEPVNDGNWHRVDLTSGVDTIEIYLDGVLQQQQTGASVEHLNMDFNQLGYGFSANYSPGSPGWEYFNGCIDDLIIVDDQLTIAEINQITFIDAPTISNFTPGNETFGGNVVITGTNFTGATEVAFGGEDATSFTVDSDTQITATVGSGASGDVTVTTAGGTASLAGFTYNSNNPVFTNPSSAFVLQNATHNENEILALETLDIGAIAVTFNNDGTKMFIAGADLFEGESTEGAVFQFALSTPYDLSTLSFETSAIELSGAIPLKISFNEDGTRLFVIAFAVNDSFDAAYVSYSLSTGFDLSSTIVEEEFLEDAPILDVKFNADGTKAYFIDFLESPRIVEVNLDTPFEISSGGESFNELDVNITDEVPFAFSFNAMGTRLYISYSTAFGGQSNLVSTYELSTPFDISTALSLGVDSDLIFGDELSVLTDLWINPDGESFLVVDPDTNQILSYDTNASIFYEENETVSVTDVNANDGDGGSNDDSITFSLEVGGDNDLFTIDSATGDLNFISPPDFELPQDTNADNRYEITIIATDDDGSTNLVVVISVTNVEDDVLSIEDNPLERLRIYPNPVGNMLYFSNANQMAISNIAIYDLQGRLVKQISVNDISQGVNVQDLESAAYVMSIQDKINQHVKKRFIKK